MTYFVILWLLLCAAVVIYFRFFYSKSPAKVQEQLKQSDPGVQGSSNINELKFICNYGKTNFYKQLFISDTGVTCKDGNEVLFEVPIASVQSVHWSANYIKLITTQGRYVVRGLLYENDPPIRGYKSLSNRQAIEDIKNFFKTKGIPLSFRLIIIPF